MKNRLIQWLLAGSVSGVLLGLLDCASLCLNARDMFFDTSEMFRALYMSTAVCGMGAIFATVSGFAATAGISRVRHKFKPWFTALLFSPVFVTLLWLLTEGPQASAIPGRKAIVIVLGLIAAAVTGLVIAKSATISGIFKQRLLAMGCAVTGLLLVVADFTVLVRLYAPFHIALTFFSWLLFTFAWQLVWKKSATSIVVIGAITLSVGFIVGGLISLQQIRNTQNIRFVITEKTAAAADVVHLSQKLVPPPHERLLDLRPEKEMTSVGDATEQKQLKHPGAPVLFITVDAMRYDRIEPGNITDTAVAPALNALASKSTVFKRAYTALPHTSYAVTSFITGKYIKPLFDIPDVTADQETWPEIMRRFHYRTGGFFTRSVFFIDRTKFKPLEKKGFGFGYLKMEYRFTAEQKINQAIEFLEKVSGDDAPPFVWVHLFEPHEPYKKECTRFGNSDEQRYDCEIHTADQHIKRLLDYADTHYPDAIIVVAADHGEEFNDHGGKYHGTTLYDEQVRVPLLIHVPGVPHNIVKEPVNLVDILGTVLSIVDIPVPPRVRSNNLSGLIMGTDTRKKAAFSQLHDRRMVLFDSHKLIWDKSSGLVRLYDLRADPGETISVADQHPQLVQLLKKKIVTWEASHAKAELRPVSADGGLQSWPPIVQRALGGDTSVVAELYPFLSNDTPEVVRRKAAELIFERWHSGLPPIPFDRVSDPVCLGWLWSAMAAQLPADTLLQLRGLSQSDTGLDPLSAAWTRAQLTRLSLHDKTAIQNVMDIAAAQKAAPAIRLEAIELLGTNNAKEAETLLMDLLGNYLLRQDAAAALARLKCRAAIEPISRYLRGEPFVARREELAEALASIGGSQVINELVVQMAMENPIPQGLSLLESIDAMRTRQTDVHIAKLQKRVSLRKGTILQQRTQTASTLHFQFPKPMAAIQVQCGQQRIADLKGIAANSLQSVSLEKCVAENGKITLSLAGDSPPNALMMAVW